MPGLPLAEGKSGPHLPLMMEESVTLFPALSFSAASFATFISFLSSINVISILKSIHRNFLFNLSCFSDFFLSHEHPQLKVMQSQGYSGWGYLIFFSTNSPSLINRSGILSRIGQKLSTSNSNGAIGPIRDTIKNKVKNMCVYSSNTIFQGVRSGL